MFILQFMVKIRSARDLLAIKLASFWHFSFKTSKLFCFCQCFLAFYTAFNVRGLCRLGKVEQTKLQLILPITWEHYWSSRRYLQINNSNTGIQNANLFRLIQNVKKNLLKLNVSVWFINLDVNFYFFRFLFVCQIVHWETVSFMYYMYEVFR